MKRFIIFPVLMIVAVLGLFAEDLKGYDVLYEAATSHAGQLDILQKMAKDQVSDASEFYARILKRLIPEYSNIKNKSERAAVNEQVILLASLLGTEKHIPAATDLWMVVEEFDTPKAKAESMIALGTMGATEYLPHVIRVLENLNVENRNVADRKNRLTAENIAYGAIIALERYKDPSGYLPVFFASVGWYSRDIKDQAAKSLPLIAEDPSSYISEIIKGPAYDYPTKLAALKTIDATRVNNTTKADIAAEAFNQGWLGASVDTKTKTTFAVDMRKLAMQMLSKYKTENEAVYPLLERSYLQGYNMDEKLYAVATLGALGTEESARRLSSYLNELNVKRLRGNIKREDEQMVRAIIPALGQTGRPEGKPALIAVGASNWTPAVIRLANDAMQRIN